MKVGYYPGCSLEGTAKEYDVATRRVLEMLGVQLVDIPDWNCCGATPAHLTHPDLALALPARILALAEAEGLEEITPPCAACYNRLALTVHRLRDTEERVRINEITGLSYSGRMKVTALPRLVLANGADAVGQLVERPLEGLKVASYYGCLLVRPLEIASDDHEDPESIDIIVKALGAEPVDWPMKTECCGGSHSLGRSDLVKDLVLRLTESAVDRGADCFATACPLCHGNLDMRQDEVQRKLGRKVPVFHFTQLMGLAFGLGEKELKLGSHLVDPLPLLKQKTL